ncbi:PH domain-containing protein [Altererythrobacter salegens]|uniref:PH domain-containing protein n=2 Tax=Croceibacterium salegens TaxID=1737568 RepID=A0A6I4SX85_9SPHN|nr:PH domain-containing protein [Croceibacterium salegens]
MALTAMLRGGLPAFAGLVGTGAIGMGLIVLLPAMAALLSISMGVAWLKWRHLTYTTGHDSIRVERGLLSRHARAVPYDRIQDVGLEQKLLPRLFGLAEVKFETGAGGKDELSLTYLSLEEADRLRELVKERKSLDVTPEVAPEGVVPDGSAAPVLFAMDNRRVMTFGLFEFSLVIFAVLLGAAQQFDFLLPFDPWNWERWAEFATSHRHDFDWLGATGRFGAVLAVVFGFLAVAGAGVLTGVARTFAREYGFTLERTAKGFRRRRGLFTRTDVVMPVHRVQALKIATGALRRRFGWHGLSFVSLAQDAKAANHAVVPFAQMDEIAPVVEAAGFELPDNGVAWHRASRRYRIDSVIRSIVAFGVPATAAAGIALLLSGGNAVSTSATAIGLALLGFVLAVRHWFVWRHTRHALDGPQLFVQHGWLAPRLDIASQVKIQSVEIVQGPIARHRGYAGIKFGLAGGTLEMHGVPLEEACGIRQAVIDSAAAVDFSALPR